MAEKARNISRKLMNKMKKILIIDDEHMVRDLIKDHFTAEGYMVYTAKDYESAITCLNAGPDLILLDINMPGQDGLSLCRDIRNYISCPILFLTAKVTEQDKVRGLMAGGDDYITKPFSLGELTARVSAHLRREERQKARNELRFSNGLVLVYDERTVYFKEKEIPFSKREFDIIELLSQNTGHVFEREQIYEKLWGLEADGNSNVVKEHVRKIRAKFLETTGSGVIETVWGVGYKWIE